MASPLRTLSCAAPAPAPDGGLTVIGINCDCVRNNPYETVATLPDPKLDREWREVLCPAYDALVRGGCTQTVAAYVTEDMYHRFRDAVAEAYGDGCTELLDSLYVAEADRPAGDLIACKLLNKRRVVSLLDRTEFRTSDGDVVARISVCSTFPAAQLDTIFDRWLDFMFAQGMHTQFKPCKTAKYPDFPAPWEPHAKPVQLLYTLLFDVIAHAFLREAGKDVDLIGIYDELCAQLDAARAQSLEIVRTLAATGAVVSLTEASMSFLDELQGRLPAHTIVRAPGAGKAESQLSALVLPPGTEVTADRTADLLAAVDAALPKFDGVATTAPTDVNTVAATVVLASGVEATLAASHSTSNGGTAPLVLRAAAKAFGGTRFAVAMDSNAVFNGKGKNVSRAALDDLASAHGMLATPALPTTHRLRSPIVVQFSKAGELVKEPKDVVYVSGFAVLDFTVDNTNGDGWDDTLRMPSPRMPFDHAVIRAVLA